MEPSNVFVCLMGLGTVFVGLICIIALCQIMSFLCLKLEAKNHVHQEEPLKEQTVLPTLIPNRQEFVAAVSAVLAEEIGADISAIRIISITKL